MSELKRIVALLKDADAERRVAAAVVLGALAVKDKECVAALDKLLTSPSAQEQKAALDAFAHIGPKKALPRIFDLLASGAPSVREAAFRALKAAGADVVDDIRNRREKAGEGEKRELDRVLAEVGGADAFKALLEGLASADEQTARAAALSVRERVSEADARTRKSYAAAVTKMLTRAPKAPKKGAAAPAGHTAQQEAALLKILGWCEDHESVPLLLDVVGDDARAAAVRQEAIIALRFALSGGAADARAVGALLDVAAGADASLARTAVDTLAGLKLDDKAAQKLVALALHRDPNRALFAVEKLGAQGGAKAAAALVDVVLRAERATAEAAADALASLPEATAPALDALLTHKGDAVRALGDLLKARAAQTAQNSAGTLPKGAPKKLLDVVVARIVEDGRNYEACLAVARAADAELTAETLRELAAKLKRSKATAERAEHVLRLLTHTGGATDDDKLRLALLALQKSRLDARPEMRAKDEAVKAFSQIIGSVDVMKALKKDKHVTDEQLFFLGFHFAEEGEPIGADLLREVIARGPRTKLAKAARNKLALEAEA